MKNLFYGFIISILMAICFSSCEKTEEDSFQLIQNEIFTPSCALSGCHASEADPYFAQHRLILTKGRAYQSLVGIDPANLTALAEKLKRVKAFSADQSLLYHKLIYDVGHHGTSYGSVMPLGADLLSQGKIDFVRLWIEAGAPLTGAVADASLLDDTTPTNQEFTSLIPPPAGKGFQMVLPKFMVAPNIERELFVHKKLNNPEKAFVNRVQIKMRPGSHHFILHDFRNKQLAPSLDLVRDIRNPDGTTNISTLLQMSNHVFMFGGGETVSDDYFPAGTAVEIPANASFDMNSHYFNKSKKEIPGEVNINLYTIPESQVKNVVKILDLGINDGRLNLPPQKRTTISGTFVVGKQLPLTNPKNTIKIVVLFSHTHKLGEKFEILISGGPRDGEVVYTSTNWEHPEKIKFDTPIELKNGEGLTSRITYNNFTTKPVTFGLTSEDEMGIIFGYYYETE